MLEPITVNYTPDGDDWTVTVAVAGEPTTRSATAVGLIAARDRADQLVAQLTPDDDHRRVVHLLDGDAYAFTNSYLQARLGLPANRDKPSDQVMNEPDPPQPTWPDATVAGDETPDDLPYPP
ncbi:MAG TPA: hypothetical protein VFW65_18300 [Pseudonocardiaceae bacterium]|nr:hypothetical protein [Pseudonocardiaceae bacterium]